MECLPINVFPVLQYFHNVGDSNRFFSDHDTELLRHLVLFVVHTECFVLEDCLVVLLSEQNIRPNIVVGMLVDLFQNSWVLKGNHIFRTDLRKGLVALDLLLLIEPQTIKTTQIGSHQLFTNALRLYFC